MQLNIPQLVWTVPVEPTDGASPPTDDSSSLPPLIDPPESSSILFPPSTSTTTPTTTPRKPTHSKKKPEDHIPRPPNAFILFRSSFIKEQHVSTGVETNHSTLSKIIGMTWKGLTDDQRLVWHAKAKVAQDEHKRKWPQYAFRPNQSKTRGGAGGGAGAGAGGGNSGHPSMVNTTMTNGDGYYYASSPTATTSTTGEKRKVREVGPKDHKRCAKIAELLVEGKTGQELDEAVQEFDKYHVPEVITRFEAPITARAFMTSYGEDRNRRRRRSSSVPVVVGHQQQEEEGEVKKKKKVKGCQRIEEEEDGVKTKKRKIRSSSSQPTTTTPVVFTPPTLAPSSVQVPMPMYEPKLEPQPSFEDLMSTFDQYPSPLSASPSFDFNTFSFDVHSSPPSTIPYHLHQQQQHPHQHQHACDPLSPLSPLSHASPPSPLPLSPTAPTTPASHSPIIPACAGGSVGSVGVGGPLSIDTSFLSSLDEWNNCPSPLSAADSSMPATPSSFLGTAAGGCPPIGLDMGLGMGMGMGIGDVFGSFRLFEGDDTTRLGVPVYDPTSTAATAKLNNTHAHAHTSCANDNTHFLGTFDITVPADNIDAVYAALVAPPPPSTTTTTTTTPAAATAVAPASGCCCSQLHQHHMAATHHHLNLTSQLNHGHNHNHNGGGEDEFSAFMASIPGYAL